MKTDLIRQYDHFWKVLSRLVNEFDDRSWTATGRKATVPIRLSFHILHATQYYIQDTTIRTFASGKPFEIDFEKADVADLPSRDDVLQCIGELSSKTEEWLRGLDLSSSNQDFPWAGRTKLGVALFLLKHSTFHLGELSSLLNESRNGEVGDNFVAALQE
jgi:hypothetical protein